MLRAPADLPDTAEHRRRTRRQARHEARAALRSAPFDEDLLEDADAHCPPPVHDLGRHPSPAPKSGPKQGRRGGFKVWKTPYWKRRSALRARRNDRLEQLTKRS
jgi:hypothetical protein